MSKTTTIEGTRATAKSDESDLEKVLHSLTGDNQLLETHVVSLEQSAGKVDGVSHEVGVPEAPYPDGLLPQIFNQLEIQHSLLGRLDVMAERFSNLV